MKTSDSSKTPEMSPEVAEEMALDAMYDNMAYYLTACEKYDPLGYQFVPTIHVVGRWDDEPTDEELAEAFDKFGDEYDEDTGSQLRTEEATLAGMKSHYYYTLNYRPIMTETAA